MSRENWIIYALGSGFGHLTRALSIGRIAAREHHVEILCNSPYAQFLQGSDAWKAELAELDLSVTTLPSSFSTKRSLERSEVVERISKLVSDPKWDKLIVDTFPRGILGELVDVFELLSASTKSEFSPKYAPEPASKPVRVLISRALNERYRTKYDINQFARNNYHLVIEPGDIEQNSNTDSGCPMIRTAPWVVRDASELPSRQAMRKNLRIGENETLILVVASGKDSELDFYWEIARQANHRFDNALVRCLAPTLVPNVSDVDDQSLWISHWPGIECIVAADIVVGSAGYNTINECSFLDVPLIATPFDRLYDCQHLRAHRATWQASEVSQVLDYLSTFLTNFSPVQSHPSYSNGASDAYLQILAGKTATGMLV